MVFSHVFILKNVVHLVSICNIDEKCFFGYFKRQISKWAHMSELLSVTRGLKDSYSLSNKQKKYVSSKRSPCSMKLYYMTFNSQN